MKKKFLCSVLAVAMFLMVFTFVGCSGTESSSPTSSAGQQSGKAVTIRVLANFSDAAQSASFAERLKKFQEENTNIVIDDWSTGDETVFNDKFKTAVAQGDPPEIFVNYGGVSQVDYAKNKIMADLTDVLNSDKAWSDKIPVSLFNDWKYSDIEGVYGIPYASFGIGIFYNKNLFTQIGSEPPETIEEFMEASEKFIAKGITPLAIGDKDIFRGGHLLSSLSMKAYGSQKTLDLCSRQAKWNDADMLSLFQLVKDMQDKGVFGQNVVTLDYNAEKAAFESGKSAMHMDGTWYFGSALSSSIADQIGFIPFPYFKDKPEYQKSWMGGATGAFCMSGLAKDGKKDAAVKLLKFISSQEHFKYMWEQTNGGFIPPMSLDDLGIDQSTVPALTKNFLEKFSEVTDLRNEIGVYDPMSQLTTKVREEIQGLFAGNTPKGTADNIQKEIDNYEANK